MKYIYKICGKMSLVCYIVTLFQLWHLGQYGGLQSHKLALGLGITGFGITMMLWMVSRRKKLKKDSEKSVKKSIFQSEVSCFIIAALFFGGHIVYSAIPYHGAL